MKKFLKVLPLVSLFLVLSMVFIRPVHASDPTEEVGSKMILCEECEGSGVCQDCLGFAVECETCGGEHKCEACDGVGYVPSPSKFYNTVFSLLPPIVAIVLALLTKEVYVSLFIGIVFGGLLYSNFSFEGTLLHVLDDGIMNVLADKYNVGILIFLVVLGIMVCLMNKAGGSAAFGRWAQKHIKTRVGAQISSVVLGCLIFIDDYFNCLTVGSVMRPVTDKYNISRSKLAYLIDATAAPICIIAPISSWAAAVAAFAEDGQGLNLFIRAIPYNFYAILTIIMVLSVIVMKFDFGLMAKHEKNAIENHDLFSGSNPYQMDESTSNTKGSVVDLVVPIAVLIACCVVGMVYSGGFFDGVDFVTAFSNSDASVGLVLGSISALIFTACFYGLRRLLTFKEMTDCIPEGFKAMVPAILILSFAWSLKAMTDSLGARYFVRDLVLSGAASMQILLPAIVFLVGCGLAFATGTSWGTFGILIPIVQSVFTMDNPLAILCISACMAGAVCGDHCSPISDTTIMASAGAQCDHVNHVSTQIPYVLVCAVISTITYIIAGVFAVSNISTLFALPIGVVMLFVALNLLKKYSR